MKSFGLLILLLLCSRTFFAQPKPNAVLIEKWKDNSWDSTSWIDYIYDQGKPSVIDQKHIISGNVTDYIRTVCNYSFTGKIIQEWTQRMFQGTWKNASRTQHFYDSEGRLSKWLVQDFSTDWYNVIQREYSYDTGSGLLTTLLTKAWSHADNEWVLFYKSTYTYDANALLMESMHYRWKSEYSSWDLVGRDQYTYTTDKLIESKLNQEWYGGNWKNFSLYSYTYNSENLLVSEKESDWKITADSWTIVQHDSLIYNPDRSVHQSISMNRAASGDIENTTRMTYFYDGTTLPTTPLSISENQLVLFNLYPNPAQETVFLSFPQPLQGIVSLIDLQGKTLHSSSFEGTSHALSLLEFAPGIYLVRVESRGNVQMQQVYKSGN